MAPGGEFRIDLLHEGTYRAVLLAPEDRGGRGPDLLAGPDGAPRIVEHTAGSELGGLELMATAGRVRGRVSGAANAGDLLKPMGFTADQAADLSTDLIGLSGALSEWSGGQRSVAETADILSKALLGERESLKPLGIAINQAQVDQRALTIAQRDGRDAITEQDKALATQQLIFEKSTDAQKAFAEGGNDLIAAQNQLRARFNQLKEDLARNLMPTFERMAVVALELMDVFEEDGLGGVIGALGDKIAEAWPSIRSKLGEWTEGFLNWVAETGPPFLAAFGSFLIDDALPFIVTKLREWLDAFVTWAQEVGPPFLDQMGEMLRRFGDWFVADGLPMIVENLAKWLAAFVQWAIDIAPNVIAKLREFTIAVGTWLLEQVPTLLGYLLEWTAAFVSWVVTDLTPNLLTALGQMMVDIAEDFVGLASDVIDAALNLGKQSVDKIVAGITEDNQVPRLGESFGNGVFENFRGFFLPPAVSYQVTHQTGPESKLGRLRWVGSWSARCLQPEQRANKVLSQSS